jgi:hypothetical protein
MTMSAPMARARDTGTGLTSAPSTSRRPSCQAGVMKARERDGGAHGGRDAAFAQPDFVAALEISGDAAEAVGQQRGEITVDEVALKEGR